MGGNLAWTIRLEDGTQYRMDRWTNSMPALIQNPDFLAGKTSAIDEALAEWKSMKADWEANQHTEAFEHYMTPTFAPYPYGMKPSEYGLVVTDFATKTILSLQNYSHLDRLIALRLTAGPRAYDISPSRKGEIENAVQAGRIQSYRITMQRKEAAEAMREIGASIEPHVNDPTSFVVTVPGSVDPEALIALCDRIREDVAEHPDAAEIERVRAQTALMPEDDPERRKIEMTLALMETSHKADNNPFLFAHAILDLSPFTLEVFDSGSQGYEALLARVLELGFELSDDERAAWDERIAEIREMEMEDA
jgi:hypothetical protein